MPFCNFKLNINFVFKKKNFKENRKEKDQPWKENSVMHIVSHLLNDIVPMKLLQLQRFGLRLRFVLGFSNYIINLLVFLLLIFSFIPSARLIFSN